MATLTLKDQPAPMETAHKPGDGETFVYGEQLERLKEVANLNQHTLYRLLNTDEEVHMEN